MHKASWEDKGLSYVDRTGTVYKTQELKFKQYLESELGLMGVGFFIYDFFFRI